MRDLGWRVFLSIVVLLMGIGNPTSAEQVNVPMVLVPAGEFIMGSDDQRPDEKPQRRVFLDAFYIDKYPVTNQQLKRVKMKPARDFGDKFSGQDQPVVGVTWSQANEYCIKVGKRLPTEAEWEKAARGTDGKMFSWGDNWEDRNKMISLINSGKRTHPTRRDYNTHNSPFGAVDMVGNVSEWVADWYDKDYYKTAPLRNPKGPATGHMKVFRGGNWKFDYFGFFRVSARARYEPENSLDVVGFRCAKDAK